MSSGTVRRVASIDDLQMEVVASLLDGFLCRLHSLAKLGECLVRNGLRDDTDTLYNAQSEQLSRSVA